jgi:hypothetical protein
MPVKQLLPPTDVRYSNSGLLDALQRWREVDTTAGPESSVPELRAIDAHRATVEQAKGALMLRYGMDTFQAFALIVRWSRLTHTPVHTLAEALVHGVGESNPPTENRHHALVHWLEDQLLHSDPPTSTTPHNAA